MPRNSIPFHLFSHLLLTIIIHVLCAGCQASLFQGRETKTEAVGPLPDYGHIKTGGPYTIGNRTYYPLTTSEGYDETGIASWYGRDFHGKKTANGERYDMHALSAAHPTLPLPTLARVTNLENGKQIVVRINDRGPFVKDRLIDLSYNAAVALGFAARGTARVRVQTLSEEPETFAIAQSPEVNTAEQSRMFVQVGAFSVEANAKRLKGLLQVRFRNVRIRTFTMNHQKWYRVQIGPMRNPFEIEHVLLSLQNDTYIRPIVVTE